MAFNDDPDAMQSMINICYSLQNMKRLTTTQKRIIPSKLRSLMYHKTVIKAHEEYNKWLFEEYNKRKEILAIAKKKRSG